MDCLSVCTGEFQVPSMNSSTVINCPYLSLVRLSLSRSLCLVSLQAHFYVVLPVRHILLLKQPTAVPRPSFARAVQGEEEERPL